MQPVLTKSSASVTQTQLPYHQSILAKFLSSPITLKDIRRYTCPGLCDNDLNLYIYNEKEKEEIIDRIEIESGAIRNHPLAELNGQVVF